MSSGSPRASTPAPSDSATAINAGSEPQDDSLRIAGLVPRHIFLLTCRVPGLDAVQSPHCALHASVCDPCAEFIVSSLGGRVPVTEDRRWTVRQTERVYGYKSGGNTRLVYHHYSSRRMLGRSAAAGCGLCRKIYDSSRAAEGDQVVMGAELFNDPRYEKAAVYVPSSPEAWARFSVFPLRRYIQGFDDGKDLQFEFVLAEDERDCLQMPVAVSNKIVRVSSVAPSPSPSASSAECYDRVRRWYEECVSSHGRCFRPVLPLPIRLLDLNPEGRDAEWVSLVNTKTLQAGGDRVRYVALSYCWGGYPQLKATAENLESMMEGIQIERLPVLVKDAVEICRKIGIRYLWVDALCIRQDNEHEWQVEAANMADVYGGCDLALSALSSSRVTESMLTERNFKPVELGSAEVSYGAWKDTFKLFARRIPRSIEEEIERSPLNKRAWPLQERVLAPAVLHYGRDQLLWECDSENLCSETGSYVKKSEAVIRLSNWMGVFGDDGKRDLWASIVEDFTRRKLSFQSDRLLAISGIASRLRQDKTRVGRYAAGLWDIDIDFQIVWWYDDILPFMHDLDFKPPNPTVPTWSWAYHDKPVRISWAHHLTSSLNCPAHFAFADPSDYARSNTEATLQRCAVEMSGFVMDLGYIGAQEGNMAHTNNVQELPGSRSRFNFDHRPVGTSQLFCLLVVESYVQNCAGYLIIKRVENLDPKDWIINTDRTSYYNRVGTLWLVGLDKAVMSKLHEDISCNSGGSLLSNGRSEDIFLI